MTKFLSTRPVAVAAAAVALVAALLASSHGVEGGCVANCQRFDGGLYFTCALTDASSNNVRCFGYNYYNQLGNSSYGSTAQFTASPMPPRDVDLNGARAVQIATGYYHACVITATGGVRCWGSNGSRRLGYGSFAPASPPHATDIEFDSPNIQAVQVVVGSFHSCVLLIDGRVSCFGRNRNNQIGTSISTETNSPPIEKKIYIQMPNNDTVKQICAGREHSCALSLQGEVACWGYNNEGQLGYPNGQLNVWNPSTVGYVSLASNSSLKALKIACGGSHTAVLLENGKVKTFGSNAGGQLGYSNPDVVGLDASRLENNNEDGLFSYSCNLNV